MFRRSSFIGSGALNLTCHRQLFKPSLVDDGVLRKREFEDVLKVFKQFDGLQIKGIVAGNSS